jgi:hypothetical protein
MCVVDYLLWCTFSALNKGTFALVYFPHCGKSCVIVQLDTTMPHVVETTKYPRFKIYFLSVNFHDASYGKL